MRGSIPSARRDERTGAFCRESREPETPGVDRRFGSHSGIDPGEPRRPRVCAELMLDVVRRYNIDGVHIDDYFYA
jgi:uncharacterized lipoprotein YddW (UPF0748 family)